MDRKEMRLLSLYICPICTTQHKSYSSAFNCFNKGQPEELVECGSSIYYKNNDKLSKFDILGISIDGHDIEYELYLSKPKLIQYVQQQCICDFNRKPDVIIKGNNKMQRILDLYNKDGGDDN